MAFHKRKQFWVDAPLQLQMLGYVLVLVAASLMLVSFSILRGLAQASAQTRQIFHSLDWVRETMRGPLIVSSCLSILASGLLTLIWSHRFAGPLRVLSAGIGRVRHGNLAVPVRVRTTDAHQDLAREFQLMQEELRKMIAADRAHVAAAVASLEAAEKSLDGHHEAKAEIGRALDELRRACVKYHI